VDGNAVVTGTAPSYPSFNVDSLKVDLAAPLSAAWASYNPAPPESEVPVNGNPSLTIFKANSIYEFLRNNLNENRESDDDWISLRVTPKYSRNLLTITEAYDQFEEFVLFIEEQLRSGAKFNPDQLNLFAHELVERAAFYYQASGITFDVSFTSEDEASIEFVSGGPIADRLIDLKNHGMTLAFRPLQNLKMRKADLYDENSQQILMDFRNALELDPDAIGLLHERRHGLNRLYPERYWGWSMATTGMKLPSAFPDNYRLFQAHDEPDSYIYSIDKALQKLGYLLATKAPIETIRRQIVLIFQLLISGVETSRRNIDIAKDARPVAERGEISIEPLAVNQYRFGAFLQIATRGNSYASLFPLPGSVGLNDPMNLELLLDRIDDFEHVSTNILTQIELMQRVWELLAVHKNRYARLIIVDALRGTLERQAFYDPTFRALNIGELTDTYNSLIDFHFGRRYDIENPIGPVETRLRAASKSGRNVQFSSQ